MKSIQIRFKQFQKINQELNARFARLRLTFQIWVLLLLTPMRLGKNISRFQVQLFLQQCFSWVSQTIYKRWGKIFLNPNFTGRCHFLIASRGQLDIRGRGHCNKLYRGGMTHMHIKILFQQSLLLLLPKFILSAFQGIQIFSCLDIFFGLASFILFLLTWTFLILNKLTFSYYLSQS